MESSQPRGRRPAQERWINEITENDIQQRIRVLGIILDKKVDQDITFIVIDDTTTRPIFTFYR